MLPGYGALARYFLVDRETVFLNHGSFGNTPAAVLHVQEQLRRQVERDPIKWFVDDAEALYRAARVRIAEFVDAEAETLMLVHNATEGVSAIVRSLEIQPGEELLTSTHEYNACSNALKFVAERSGGVVRVVEMPCPVVDPEAIVEAIVGGISARTRLLLVSHITSPSAMILPMARIIDAAAARATALGNDRMRILVDGAHGPGYVDLSVRSLLAAGAHWYTGNLHKWTCGPKGTAFVATRRDEQATTAPLIISHGYNALPREGRSRYRELASFYGSMDYTGWMVIPATLDHLSSMHGQGLAGLRAEQASLRAYAQGVIGEALADLGPQAGAGLVPAAHEGSMLGAMVTLQLPARPAHAAPVDPHAPFDPMYYALRSRWRVQVPVYSMAMSGGVRGRVVRVSAGIYNTRAQMDYLAAALRAEVLAERRGG